MRVCSLQHFLTLLPVALSRQIAACLPAELDVDQAAGLEAAGAQAEVRREDKAVLGRAGHVLPGAVPDAPRVRGRQLLQPLARGRAPAVADGAAHRKLRAGNSAFRV